VKRRNFIRFIAVFGIWLLGLAVIWWLTPVGPRDGWQLPKGEFVIGFLSDSQTLVTSPVSAGRRQLTGDTPTGILRLWNVETGQLVGSHLASEDGGEQFFIHDYRFEVLAQHNLILAEKTVEVISQQSRAFRMSLYNGTSGRNVASFSRIGYWDPRFGFDSLFQDFGSFTLSPDGKTLAFVNFDANKPRVELRDRASGNLVHSLLGWREPICFSPDSTRFAVNRIEQSPSGGVISTIGVFETATARELGLFAHHHPIVAALDPAWRPKEFAPNGDRLIDSVGQVWDLATGEVLCKIAGVKYDSCFFTPDGRCVVAVVGSNTESWLAYFDVDTGTERVEQRLPLFTGAKPVSALLPMSADKRPILAVGPLQYRNSSAVARWLGRIPGLSHLRNPAPDRPFAIINAASGSEVLRGDGAVCGCSPDGRFLVSIGASGMLELWDIPPRRPLSTALPWLTAWSALLGVLVWSRIRRKAHSPTVAAANPESAAC
jgi:WD40 repeat protein